MESELLTSSKIRSVLEEDGSHVDLCLPCGERNKMWKPWRMRIPRRIFQHTYAADIYCDKCKLFYLCYWRWVCSGGMICRVVNRRLVVDRAFDLCFWTNWLSSVIEWHSPSVPNVSGAGRVEPCDLYLSQLFVLGRLSLHLYCLCV